MSGKGRPKVRRKTAEDWAREWACHGCRHFNNVRCDEGGPKEHGCISFSRILSYTKIVVRWARRRKGR